MGTTYQLIEPLTTEHERNKGPMPSGYAQLKLRLQPTPPGDEAGSVLVSPGPIWKIRPSREAEKEEPGRLQRLVGPFMAMIVQGVREGAEYALAHSLDQPVTNATVILEQVAFDIVYSTKFAFCAAARSAVEQLLKLAAEEGLLRVHPED